MASGATWAVTAGPGTVDSTGLYTAPSPVAAASATVTATSTADGTKTASVVIPLVGSGGNTVLNNSGDNLGFTDAAGNIWAADYGYMGSSIAYSVKVPANNAPADLQHLYTSARYTGYDLHDFSYQYSLPNGTYKVTLKFADLGTSPPGYWVFDIKLNGSTIYAGFDPVALGGVHSAIDVVATVTVSGGLLTIELNGGTHYAIINGISITP
jgi:hypothetical protein